MWLSLKLDPATPHTEHPLTIPCDSLLPPSDQINTLRYLH